MDEKYILSLLNKYYPIDFDEITFFRDSGCISYIVSGNDHKYFLRITKKSFSETITSSLDIHLYLQNKNFFVPPIIFTKDNKATFSISFENEKRYFILYEYIKGEQSDPTIDAEELGSFIGKLHQIMKSYPGKLPICDKQFYVDRYIQIMRAKQYKNADLFASYGNILWEKVKNLPRGFCHGDMYRGNILKTDDGCFYLLDLDTFCYGFLLYDPALLCNVTDYFDLEENGAEKTKKIFERFTTTYEKLIPFEKDEKEAVYDIIALYHFALQATIIEIFGMDCVDNDFFDRQLSWLQKWQNQCSALKL